MKMISDEQQVIEKASTKTKYSSLSTGFTPIFMLMALLIVRVK